MAAAKPGSSHSDIDMAELDRVLHAVGFQIETVSPALLAGRLPVTEGCCQPLKVLLWKMWVVKLYMEDGPVAGDEEGAADRRGEGDAALQPARAGQPTPRRRRPQEVRRRWRCTNHHRHQQTVKLITCVRCSLL
uniref:Uncharacterized protein n=1 Tax=Aegilops tauschii TaxID=37682 RepID=N1QUL1_AEGTA